MDNLKLILVLVVLGYVASGCGSSQIVSCDTVEKQDVRTYGVPAKICTSDVSTTYYWNSPDFAKSYVSDAKGDCNVSIPYGMGGI